MQKPVIERRTVAAELRRGADNPRNSEGDFATLQNGDILFAYSRYTGSDGEDDSPCDIAGLLSHDGGHTFTPLPHLLAAASEQEDAPNIMSVTLRRLPNGELCMFYLCKHPPLSGYYLRRAVCEEEARFGRPEAVIPERDGVYYVVNNSRVLITSDGVVWIPAAMHNVIRNADGQEEGDYFATAALFTADGDGKNWREMPHRFALPQPGYSETGLQEPGLTELADGRLYAYFRTDRAFQYESVSADGGNHWTTPTQSRFTSPESPMLIARNPYSGLYYAFWNPVPLYNGRLDPDAPWIAAGRSPFVMAVSENGMDFSPYTVLEDDPTRGYCYPAVHFLNERELLLSYCCGGPEDGSCLTYTRITRLTLRL